MAKQLNVNLAFTANTSEAKKQLQDLQQQLNQLANMPVSLKGKGITKEIIEASNAAAELKVHLDKATNVQTGNLDFTKLSQSIKNSNSSLAEYGEKLKSLGPAGNTAFQALAQSVAKAEIPIRRSNAALTEMWTALKNTARWQVSSSILHGFMGAVQSAYGYAQDLNSSLNNIRIVTGQNTEQMARFAEEANKAARALSATTTDYTNASLIYYQQGLSDSEVAKRTEVTVKMANVAGVSAEKVSDQLTAVWNNFYDGSKSLEYYADVMTALGAATASSTDEISEGLNKFAAVAETVGLSYEYATSALATVTATTRESADVVGTAFKTLFARIQGLTLGETLEDGTDLNKYSEALHKVGIDIKDTNGNMKEMDAILNELGAKWQTLGKDQQTALAQTVAGVRQYTQLVALMDNWDYFQENLGVASGASGALQEQADIYAESWKAAQKRVSAAAEAIYSDLLNDDFFIDVLNGFEKFLGLIDHLLDSMGGVQGALAGISALVLKLFSSQISQGITNMAYNMKMMTESGRQAVQAEQKAFITDAADSLNPSMDSTIEGQMRSESLKTQLGLQVSMIENIDKMSEAEKEVNSMYMDRLRMLGEEVALRAKTVDEAKERTSEASLNVRAQALETTRMWTTDEDVEGRKKAIQETNDAVNKANKRTKRNIGVENIIANSSDKIRKDGKVTEETLNKITKAMEILKKKGAIAFDDILKDMPQVGDSAEIVEDKLRQIEKAAHDAVDELATQDYADAGVLRAPEGEVDAIQNLTEAYREEIRVSDEAKEAKKAEADLAEDLENKILNAEGSQKKWSDTLVASAQSVSTMVMGLSSLGAAWDALTNPDLSGWEKFVSVSTSLAMGLPAVISGMTGLNDVLNLTNAARMVSIMRLGEESKAQAANTLAKVLGISTETALAVVTEALTLGKGKLTLANLMEAASNNKVTISKGLETAATIAQTVANWGLLASMPPLLAILLVLVAVVGGLALIIWGVVSAANALSDAYNADAIAAEKAEKGAENLANAYNGVKQEYEDMIASMENYKSARDALDNLTEGTKAYDAALKEANRAAMELVNQHRLIEGQDYEWQGNELIIKDEAMDRALAAKEAEADEAYAASQMANANAKALRTQSNLTDARREIRDDNGLGDGDLIWQGIGAGLLNSILPGVGNLIMANQISESAEMDATIQRAVEEAKDNQNLFDTKKAMVEALNIDLNDTDLINALWANQEQIKGLANEMNAAEAAWKLAAQNSANELLNDNEVVQNSNNTEEVMAAGGKVYGAAYDEAYNKYLSNAQSRGLFNTGTDASKAAFEEYAKKAGLDQLKNFKVTNYKGDGTVEYKYIDEQGKEQVKLATAEEIAATLAAAEAATQLGASAEKLVGIFNTLDDSGNEAAQALKNIIAYGDVENATRAEFQDLQEEYKNADDKTAYLNKTFGGANGVIDEEELKALGYESIEALQAGVEQAIKNGKDAWNDVGKSLTNTARTAFKNSMQSGMFDDLTLEQTNQMANLFKEAFENGGVEGLNSLQNNLSVMFEKSGKDASEMAAILGGVDWQTTNIEDLTAMLEEAGIETDGFADELANLIELMQEGQNIGFDGAAEIYKTAHEIIDGLETGDTISSEDYENLKAMGINMSDYFVQMADGSYKLTADAKEFYDIVNSKSLEQFQNNIQNLIQQQNDVNTLQNSGYTKDSIATMETKGVLGSIVQDNDKLGDQLTFLKAIGSDLENLDSYIQEIESGGQLTQRQLREIRTELEENASQWDNLSQVTEGFDAEIQRNMDAYAMSAATVGDLNDMLQAGLINAEAYGKAIESVMDKEFEMEGLDPDVANEVADAFRDMADAGVEGMEALRDDEEAVKDATVRYMELNEAIEDIYDNYEDYVDVLKAAKKALTPVEKANLLNEKSAKSLRKSLAGLLGTTEDLIDADLMAAIDPKDFEAAANGNAEAIERIRNQFIDLQAQIYGCESEADAFKQRLAELADGAYIDLNTDPFLSKLIQAAVNAGATATDIQNMLRGFEIDADVTPFTEELWQATQNAQAAGKNIANATSFTTEVETSDVDASSEVELPQYQEVASAQTRVMGYNQVPLGNGFTAAIFPSVITTTSKRVDTSTVPQTIEKTETAVGQSVTTGDGNTSKGGVIVKNAHKATTASKTPSASNTSRPPVGSKGGGGGGSNPKAPSKIDKRDMTQKSDVVQRYREIDDSIDNVTDALTRAEQAASRLWGKDKINAMKEENKLLKQQYKLIQDKAEQAREYAEEDYAELMRTASEAGISLVVDRATGDITNIEDGLDTLYDRLESAEKEYNKKVEEYNNAVLAATKSDGTVSESDSKRLETMKEALDAYEEDFIGGIEDDIEAVQNAEKQFQESVETWEQAGLDMESILDSIMQNNYDIIMEGLEIPLSLNEEDLRYIELKLSQIEDDMYSMSEAVALTSSELSEYKDNLRLADEALAELNRAHEAGEITDAAYQEGLGEIRDKYYENVESLMELDKTMKEYYSNTLDMANEELSKYTDQMEHQTSVLEHYQSLIELMGKSADYKMIGKILEGQVETTKNSMEVSKQWYETQRNNADALAAEYAAALANNASEAELEIIKANWEAAEASANEAQDQMLSDAEAWAEALKAVLENELADLSQTLENALTGGTSFDTLTTQMERAASLQEEYLTTTNQIYETNKLMRTAQQEIDKTTNAVAKKKLKAYINETEQLQNQSKLSQYELEIQQAKYNLLLAEIALQEAQDAKSTVRLQRDSEGNFGYVYTADSNKINEAQQKLEDAQNDLYNKGLDGANDYAQKYQQTMQEMYDTLADIQQRHLDGEYETEAEYHAAMEEAKAYYYQKLQDYSSLYSVAVTADSRVVADAWSTDFASMIYDTDNWKQAVEDYTDDAIAAFTKWQNAITGEGGIADLIGNSVEDVGKTVQEVTDKSKELAKKTQEEVIPALDKELDSVNNLTGAYAKMRDTIKETIEYYTNMINRINNSQTSDWNNGSEGSDDSSTPEDGGSGNGGGNSDTIPGGQDDGQGEGSPDTIPGGSPEGEGGSGISYHSGTLKFSGSGANRVWTDASGKTYAYGSPEQKAFQKAFDKAYGRNGGYKGDYWIGWSGDGGKLNADVLHEKYGLATGGYTGDWAGSYGKLAFLHQKELVLNAQDTENFLASMEVMERILQVIDMQSANAQLGGILSSPGFNSNNSQVIEQSVHIEASFPGVQDRSEIEEAFNNLINKASQYANRK